MGKGIICPTCGSKKIKFYLCKNNHKLYECLECRLIFVWPMPLDLSGIYNKEYFLKKEEKNKGFGYLNYEKDKRRTRKFFNHRLEEIGKIVPDKKIFDAGAATGYFLDLACNQGWKTYGIELSDYAGSIARKKGHKIFLGSLENLRTKEKFSLVTMWDILEHLKDPKKCLKIVNQILRKEGILAIVTVNKNNLSSSMPAEHLFYFLQKNLRILLQKTGFEIIKMNNIGKRYPLEYVFIIANKKK
jgi:SAM-dependent methyltransferase